VILRKSGNRAAFEVCPSFLVQRGAQKCSGRQEEANGGMKFSFKKTAFLRLVFFGGGSKNTVEKIRGSGPLTNNLASNCASPTTASTKVEAKILSHSKYRCEFCE